jgi:hypothetical protein
MDKLKLLNRIDILYIKSILRSEQANKQAELEQEQQEQKPEYIKITNILHIQNELETITNILNKLN